MTTPSKADAVKLAREMLDWLEGVTRPPRTEVLVAKFTDLGTVLERSGVPLLFPIRRQPAVRFSAFQSKPTL